MPENWHFPEMFKGKSYLSLSTGCSSKPVLRVARLKFSSIFLTETNSKCVSNILGSVCEASIWAQGPCFLMSSVNVVSTVKLIPWYHVCFYTNLDVKDFELFAERIQCRHWPVGLPAWFDFKSVSEKTGKKKMKVG